MAQPDSTVATGKLGCTTKDAGALDSIFGDCVQWSTLRSRNNVCCLQEKVEVPDKNYYKQKMLLGTHTSEEEQNHLLLAEVHLPTEDSELSSAQYDEEQSETGGYGASPGAIA